MKSIGLFLVVPIMVLGLIVALSSFPPGGQDVLPQAASRVALVGADVQPEADAPAAEEASLPAAEEQDVAKEKVEAPAALVEAEEDVGASTAAEALPLVAEEPAVVEEEEEADIPLGLLDAQVSDENRVIVEVRPLEGFPAGDTWVFSISLNTHSVALDGDLMEISVLRDENGQEYAPQNWDGSPPGGHHRGGTLAFEAPNIPRGRWELVIKNVADVPERVFAWELGNEQASEARKYPTNRTRTSNQTADILLGTV